VGGGDGGVGFWTSNNIAFVAGGGAAGLLLLASLGAGLLVWGRRRAGTASRTTATPETTAAVGEVPALQLHQATVPVSAAADDVAASGSSSARGGARRRSVVDAEQIAVQAPRDELTTVREIPSPPPSPQSVSGTVPIPEPPLPLGSGLTVGLGPLLPTGMPPLSLPIVVEDNGVAVSGGIALRSGRRTGRSRGSITRTPPTAAELDRRPPRSPAPAAAPAPAWASVPGSHIGTPPQSRVLTVPPGVPLPPTIRTGSQEGAGGGPTRRAGTGGSRGRDRGSADSPWTGRRSAASGASGIDDAASTGSDFDDRIYGDVAADTDADAAAAMAAAEADVAAAVSAILGRSPGHSRGVPDAASPSNLPPPLPLFTVVAPAHAGEGRGAVARSDRFGIPLPPFTTGAFVRPLPLGCGVTRVDACGVPLPPDSLLPPRYQVSWTGWSAGGPGDVAGPLPHHWSHTGTAAAPPSPAADPTGVRSSVTRPSSSASGAYVWATGRSAVMGAEELDTARLSAIAAGLAAPPLFAGSGAATRPPALLPTGTSAQPAWPSSLQIAPPGAGAGERRGSASSIPFAHPGRTVSPAAMAQRKPGTAASVSVPDAPLLPPAAAARWAVMGAGDDPAPASGGRSALPAGMQLRAPSLRQLRSSTSFKVAAAQASAGPSSPRAGVRTPADTRLERALALLSGARIAPQPDKMPWESSGGAGAMAAPPVSPRSAAKRVVVPGSLGGRIPTLSRIPAPGAGAGGGLGGMAHPPSLAAVGSSVGFGNWGPPSARSPRVPLPSLPSGTDVLGKVEEGRGTGRGGGGSSRSPSVRRIRSIYGDL